MTDNETVEDGGANSAVDEMAKLLGGEAEAEETEESPTDEAEPVDTEEEDSKQEQGEEEPQAEGDEEGDFDKTQKVFVENNGKRVEMTYAEMEKLAQRGMNYERKAESLQSQREALEQEIQQNREARTRYLDGIGKFEAYITRNSEYGQMTPTDWLTLSNENPAEWARLRQQKEFDDDLLEKARAEKTKHQENETSEYQQTVQEFAKDQHDKLFKSMPEMQNEQSMKRWYNFVISEGFSEEQIKASPLHHKIVIWAEKARRYDDAQKRGAEKHPTKAPRMLKPGAAKSKNPDNLAQMQKRAAKTGNPRDAAAVLAQFLGSN